ncbi:MAG: hypothetical protein J5850_06370, partial [Clostridia bacterium]|nr:hypothetical protein [Clostridia bacterium]
GLKELENKALSKIGSYIEEKTGLSDANNVLFKFAGLRECAMSFDDVLYIEMTETICRYYLEKDPLIKDGYIKLEKLSFAGSNFFNTEDDIELYASARVFGWVRIGTGIRTRAWIRGDNPLLSLDEAGTTVWELSNFARGKILRTLFGANLPYDYPVLSAFNSKTGAATVIKSLDFTAPHYETGKNMEKEIKEMINKFDKFKGSGSYNTREEYPVINASDIKSKKLLLIIPTNDLSELHSEVLREMIVFASSKGILFETVSYQKSSRFSKNGSGDPEADTDGTTDGTNEFTLLNSA